MPDPRSSQPPASRAGLVAFAALLGVAAAASACSGSGGTGTAVAVSPATAAPSASPTATPHPSASPSAAASPTATPTGRPTASPTAVPTSSPTAVPTASPTAVPTASPTAVPTPTATPTPPPVDLQPSSLSFLATGSSAAQTFDATESGFSGSFTASTPAAGTANSCSGIATIAPTSSAKTFTVTPVSHGHCTFSVSDGRQSSIETIDVSTTTVGGS